MLQKLNERVKGIFAWTVIIIVTSSFILFGMDYYLQARHGQNVVAKINDEFITTQSLDLNYRRIQIQNNFEIKNLTEEKKLKKQILETMILKEASMQAAKKAGFLVNTNQANRAILNIPQFKLDGHFSPSKYQQALSSAMFTPETFQKEVMQGMLLNQQRFAFIGTEFSLPYEIKRYIQLTTQTRDYRYVVFPLSAFTQKIQVDEAEIKKYYDSHMNEFIAPEEVSLEYILLSLEKIKEKLTITDAELNQFYEENKNHYLKPAQWQIAHILFSIPANAPSEVEQRIGAKAEQVYSKLKLNPDSFEEQARQHSDDKHSLPSGVLPWMGADSEEEFNSVLINLTQVGQISSPFKTSAGYEIFKLIAYQPASIKAFNEVKNELIDTLKAEKAQAIYSKNLEKLSELSYQNPDSLTPISKVLALPIMNSAFFSQSRGHDSITQSSQVIAAAFSPEVLGGENNSDPIQLNDDAVIVLRIKEHHPKKQVPFVEAYDAIEQKILKTKAQAEAQQTASSFVRLTVAEQNKIIQERNLKWANVKKASRDEMQGVDAEINNFAFQLSLAKHAEGVINFNQNWVAVFLQRVYEGESEPSDKELQLGVAEQLESNLGMLDLDFYLNNINKNYTIIHY